MNYASRNHTVYKISNNKSSMIFCLPLQLYWMYVLDIAFFELILELYWMYVLNIALVITYKQWTVYKCVYILGNGLNNMMALPIIVYGTFFQKFCLIVVRFILVVLMMGCIEDMDFLPYFFYFILIGVPPLLEHCKRGEITDYEILEP